MSVQHAGITISSLAKETVQSLQCYIKKTVVLTIFCLIMIQVLIPDAIYFLVINPTIRHGCILDAFWRRLIQRLRDISKRADLQISETSPWRLIKDVSSETSLSCI